MKQQASEETRGHDKEFEVEKILARGYGFATIYYQNIEPDFKGGYVEGIRPVFFKPGQTEPAPDDWGAIGAWAYGLSRAMDYLEKDKDVDAKRVAIMGHSRLGKTVLWAGAHGYPLRHGHCQLLRRRWRVNHAAQLWRDGEQSG